MNSSILSRKNRSTCGAAASIVAPSLQRSAQQESLNPQLTRNAIFLHARETKHSPFLKIPPILVTSRTLKPERTHRVFSHTGLHNIAILRGNRELLWVKWLQCRSIDSGSEPEIVFRAGGVEYDHSAENFFWWVFQRFVLKTVQGLILLSFVCVHNQFLICQNDNPTND